MILSGYTPCNITFAGDTRANIATNLISILTANGWSVAVNNGPTDQVLQSGTTPAGQKARIHVKDPGGSANCCQLMPQRASAGVDIATHWLLPGATTTYRVIANPYQFFIFRDGVLPNAREYACLVVPFCPPGVAALSSDIFFSHGNAVSDTDASVTPGGTFINNRTIYNGLVNTVIGVNGFVVNYGGSGAGMPGFVFLGWDGRAQGTPIGYQFHDNSFVVLDVLIQYSATAWNSSTDGLLVGWIWDAILLTEVPPVQMATIRNFPVAAGGANHQWYVLGNSFQYQMALLVN